MNWDLDPFYTSVCSAQTIQSNKRGFFLDYADHVTDIAGSNWLDKKFGKAKTDRERIDCILGNNKVNEAMTDTLQHVTQLYRSKNSKVSHDRRLQGDAALQAGQFQKALTLYSQAVLRAPPAGCDLLIDGGLSLALSLWCRAGALISGPALEGNSRGSLALADLQLALKVGLPASQRAELYWRMAKCYKDMGEFAKAKVSFGLSDRLLGNNDSARQQLILDIEDLENSENKTQIQQIITKELPCVVVGENPTLPGATASVAVVEKEGAGRLVVAKTSLNTGDTVLVEDPQAACLLPEYFGTHCYHCFTRLLAPVGCPDCAGVAFCSVACRDTAIGTYHKFECKYLDLLIGSGMSILCHVALRLVTQYRTPAEALAKAQGPLKNLCGHSDKREPKDYLHRVLMAIFLTRCLQKADFFVNTKKKNNNEVKFLEEELEITELILRYLQQLQFNAHEIYETRLGAEHKFKGSKPIYIGVAIYASAALFNHDCYPGVTRYFVGRKLVLKTIRPIPVGGIVAENYGPIFTKRTKNERLRSLASRYWFKCNCQSCIEDWPTFKTMDNDCRLRCPTKNCSKLLSRPSDLQKKIKCPACKKQVFVADHALELQHCEQQYTEAAQLMDDQKPTEAISLFCSAIDRFHKVAGPPHKDTHIAQEALRTCMADAGNVYQPIIPVAAEREAVPVPANIIATETDSKCKIVEIID